MTPCEKKTNKKFQMARFCMALFSSFSLTGVVFLYDVISFRMASFSSSKRRDGTNQPPYLLDMYLHLEKGREPFDTVHVLGNQLITGVHNTGFVDIWIRRGSSWLNLKYKLAVVV